MRMRIAKVTAQVSFVIAASIVGFLGGWGVAMSSTLDDAGRFIAGAAVVVVLACARLFQPVGGRPAWKLTESPSAAWIWSALFAGSGVQVVAGVVEGLTAEAQRDVGFTYIAVGIAFASSGLLTIRQERRSQSSDV